MDLTRIARQLSEQVSDLPFSPPVAHVYNPLDYAWVPHRAYLERFGAAPREVLLVGMNPGPWGMAQTGVPFGEVSLVREWMGIEGVVGHPSQEHPKRPIQGFACRRSEVSGRRVWSWARDVFGTPERFFARFFVYNYCPLLFLEESGRNRTPDRLGAGDRAPLLEACDRALRLTVEHLRPQWVVGVGGFAAARAQKLFDGHGPRLGRVLHPSPASPAANRGWSERATGELRAMGIELAAQPDGA